MDRQAGGLTQPGGRRLHPDVMERFRADGPGRQGRINEALRRAVGL